MKTATLLVMFLCLSSPLGADPAARGPAVELPLGHAVVAAKVVKLTEINKSLKVFTATFEVTEVFAGVAIKPGDNFEGNTMAEDPNGVLIMPIPKVGETGLWRLDAGFFNAGWSVDTLTYAMGVFPARDGVDCPGEITRASMVARMLKIVWEAEPDRRLDLLESYMHSKDGYIAGNAAVVLGGDVVMPPSKFENNGPILEQMIQKPGMGIPAITVLDVAVCSLQGAAWGNSKRRADLLVAAMIAADTNEDISAFSELEAYHKFTTVPLIIKITQAFLANKLSRLVGDDTVRVMVAAVGDPAKTPEDRHLAFDFLIKLLEKSKQDGIVRGCLAGIYRLKTLEPEQVERLRVLKPKYPELSFSFDHILELSPPKPATTRPKAKD